MAEKSMRICLGEGGELEGVVERCIDIPIRQIEALIERKAVIVDIEKLKQSITGLQHLADVFAESGQQRLRALIVQEIVQLQAMINKEGQSNG